MSGKERDKNSFLFKRLILTFHTAAMQQMGKLPGPAGGEIKRELEQASLSIDTIEMLKNRCKGNLTPDEAKFLEQVLSELKLNYVDEISRPSPNTEKVKNN